MLKVPATAKVREIFSELSKGKSTTDFRFDSIFPAQVRRLSKKHWTPVDVARRAAEMLYVGRTTKVLDVGSGPGKFCLVAALTSKGRFTGIEQRGYLAQFAQEIADEYGVNRATFVEGPMESIDWSPFTGFYLYNPFIEHLYDDEERIDPLPRFSAVQFGRQISWARKKLQSLRVGTRVVTYHGIGAPMPPQYVPKIRETMNGDYLVLWEKIS